MSDNLRMNLHGERLSKLETRMDNNDKTHNEVKESLKEVQHDLKWQTKQIFMGMGALGMLYILIQIFGHK